MWDIDGVAVITNFDFADSIVIFAEILEAFVDALDTLNTKSQPFGLKVSWSKTKIQTFVAFVKENIYLPPSLAGQGVFTCSVDNFVNLGSTISSGG